MVRLSKRAVCLQDVVYKDGIFDVPPQDQYASLTRVYDPGSGQSHTHILFCGTVPLPIYLYVCVVVITVCSYYHRVAFRSAFFSFSNGKRRFTAVHGINSRALWGQKCSASRNVITQSWDVQDQSQGYSVLIVYSTMTYQYIITYILYFLYKEIE